MRKSNSKKKPTRARAKEAEPSFYESYLMTVRGIDVEFAEKNVVVKDRNENIHFTYVHPLTRKKLDTYNTRLAKPFIDKNDKEGKKLIKFLRSKGPGHPYFAPCIDWKRVFADVSVSLIVSEGETRSLAAAQHNLACVAFSGVDGGYEKDTHRGALHPVFDKMVFKKGRRRRIVYLAFDVDAESNRRVHNSENTNAGLFAAKGADVRIVRIPRITKDGKTGLDDLLAQPYGVEIFKGLCDAAPVWAGAQSDGAEPQIECLADVKAEKVPWLWEGYLAFGMMAMLSGDPSAGKTFIALAIAASLSNGYIPSSNVRCAPISTLYLSHENSSKYVIRPRWDAQKGNPRRFYTLNESVTMQDVPKIRAALLKTKAKLLIIDPLQSFLGADVDAHRSNETRPVMDGLIQLAEELGVCILIIRHLAKSSGGRAIHRGLGSIDLTGAVRTEMLAGSSPDNPDLRAMVQVKTNIGKFAPSLGYAITGEDHKAHLEWRGKSELTAADLLAPESSSNDNKRKTQIESAADYLREALKDGPRLVNELVNDQYSLKVLQKAQVGMRLKKTRDGEHGAWRWALPNEPAKFTQRGGAEFAQWGGPKW